MSSLTNEQIILKYKKLLENLTNPEPIPLVQSPVPPVILKASKKRPLKIT